MVAANQRYDRDSLFCKIGLGFGLGFGLSFVLGLGFGPGFGIGLKQ